MLRISVFLRELRMIFAFFLSVCVVVVVVLFAYQLKHDRADSRCPAVDRPSDPNDDSPTTTTPSRSREDPERATGCHPPAAPRRCRAA